MREKEGWHSAINVMIRNKHVSNSGVACKLSSLPRNMPVLQVRRASRTSGAEEAIIRCVWCGRGLGQWFQGLWESLLVCRCAISSALLSCAAMRTPVCPALSWAPP